MELDSFTRGILELVWDLTKGGQQPTSQFELDAALDVHPDRELRDRAWEDTEYALFYLGDDGTVLSGVKLYLNDPANAAKLLGFGATTPLGARTRLSALAGG
jgi:hypothetical protein